MGMYWKRSQLLRVNIVVIERFNPHIGTATHDPTIDERLFGASQRADT